MPIDSLAGIILAALGVLAVMVALLLPHVLSSAPVLHSLEWYDALPSLAHPCACGESAAKG